MEVWYSSWPEAAPAVFSSASNALSSVVVSEAFPSGTDVGAWAPPTNSGDAVSKLTTAMHRPALGFVDIDSAQHSF